MSFTYTAPGTSDGDTVRFLIGDTTSTDYILEDAEITWLVAQWGDVYLAAAAACDMIGTRFATESATVSKKVGDLQITDNYSGRAQHYAALAGQLRKQSTRLAPPVPWVHADAVTRTEAKDGSGSGADLRIGWSDWRSGND